jgi:hypothetical protein
MNKFRKLGLIDYNGHLEIHSSLLNVVSVSSSIASAIHGAGRLQARAWVAKMGRSAILVRCT